MRYRVRSRSRAISTGGTKLPRSRPHSNSCASHDASDTSVLRPGTFLTCSRVHQQQLEAGCVLEHMPDRLPIRPGRFHRHLGDPLLDEPVPKLNQTIGERRELPHHLRPAATALGVRTAAITVFLCTSNPAQRCHDHIHHQLLASDRYRVVRGAASEEILRLVLAATIKSACRLPHQSEEQAHGTTELLGVGGRHAGVSSPTSGPANLTCGLMPHGRGSLLRKSSARPATRGQGQSITTSLGPSFSVVAAGVVRLARRRPRSPWRVRGPS